MTSLAVLVLTFFNILGLGSYAPAGVVDAACGQTAAMAPPPSPAEQTQARTRKASASVCETRTYVARIDNGV